MDVESYERLAYLACDDAPEAEFLATGCTGEDVVYRSMDTALSRQDHGHRLLGRCRVARPRASRASRGSTSPDHRSASFRMRVGMIHLPLPYIGGLQQPSMSVIRSSAEMKPWTVGGEYDEPIARRLAEEAGVPRASFGQEKLAVSQRIHAFGLERDVGVGTRVVRAICRTRGAGQPAAQGRHPEATSVPDQGRARSCTSNR